MALWAPSEPDLSTVLHWTGKDMERELKLYLTTFLVCTPNLFLFVSLEVRALGILKKTVMNARPRIIGKILFPTVSLMLPNIQEQSQKYI